MAGEDWNPAPRDAAASRGGSPVSLVSQCRHLVVVDRRVRLRAHTVGRLARRLAYQQQLQRLPDRPIIGGKPSSGYRVVGILGVKCDISGGEIMGIIAWHEAREGVLAWYQGDKSVIFCCLQGAAPGSGAIIHGIVHLTITHLTTIPHLTVTSWVLECKGVYAH